MSRFQNEGEVLALVAEEKATAIDITVRGYVITDPDAPDVGDTVFPTADGSKVFTGSIEVADVEPGLYLQRERQVNPVIHKIHRLKNAGVIMLAHDLANDELVGYILGKIGMDTAQLDDIRETIGALLLPDLDAQVKVLSGIWGSDRLQAVVATIEDAKADGIVTPSDLVFILKTAKGEF